MIEIQEIDENDPGSNPALRSCFTPSKSLRMDISNERSPKPRKVIDDEGEIETLLLTHFTAAPKVDFGKIRLGKSVTRRILVRNPHEYEQHVLLEKFPFKAGEYFFEDGFLLIQTYSYVQWCAIIKNKF